MSCTKLYLFAIPLLGMFLTFEIANAQIKKAVQFTTLAPALVVISSPDIIPAHKHHYTLSTISYLGLYQITESKWKAAVITFMLGLGKELIYDEMLGKGNLDKHDIKWNSFGTIQGVVFSVSLKF